MPLNIQNTRVTFKYSTITGETPTIAPSLDHCDGTWSPSDLYVGEFFLNAASDTLWIRTLNGIIPITSGTSEIAISTYVNKTGDTMFGGLTSPTFSATTGIYSPYFEGGIFSGGTFYGNGSNLTGITATFNGGTVTGNTIFTGGVDLCGAAVTIDSIEVCSGSTLQIIGNTEINGTLETTNDLTVGGVIYGDGSGISNLPAATGLTLADVLSASGATGENWIEVEPSYGLRRYLEFNNFKQVQFNTSEILLENILSGNTARIQLIDNGRTIIQSDEIQFDSPDITVATSGGGGIKYISDYAEDYTNRSLVDKEYVDSQITGATKDLSLATVLLSGNTTEGTNIILSSGDKIAGNVGETYTDDYVFYASEGQWNLESNETNTEGKLILGQGTTDSIFYNRQYDGDNFDDGRLKIDSRQTKLGVEQNISMGSTALSYFDVNVSFGYPTQDFYTTDLDGNETLIHIEAGLFEVTGYDAVGAGFRGIEYTEDYSANYTNRSLVDKEYVDTVIGTATTLSSVLLNGNTTEGSDIIIENDDAIVFESTDLKLKGGNDGTFDYIEMSDSTNSYLRLRDNWDITMRTSIGTNAASILMNVEDSNIDIAATSESNSVALTLTPTTAIFSDSRETQTGIEYLSDYSATYTDRSLVDKAYVDSVASGTTATGSFGITIDGGGSAITSGVQGYVEVPYSGVITSWTLIADQVGDCVIDVWKDTYANYPPTIADTIAGSEKPTLSSSIKNQDNSLSTWTTTVNAGDIIAFNVDSASVVTRVTLSIKITK